MVSRAIGYPEVMRRFNVAGPCRPDEHYMVPPEARIPAVRGLVDAGQYFVLHAPRQVGKTTALLALAQALTAEGRYAAVVLSCEVGQAAGDDYDKAEAAVLGAWRRQVIARLPDDLQPPPWPDAAPGSRIRTTLDVWVRACARPLVVFLDEIDALQGASLISVLRQLRDGHSARPSGFPHALALVGLRDVRDYKIAAGGSERLGTSSPFNIKSDSLTMRVFNAPEVAALYAQHAAETGQRFDDDAVARAFELTRGQPWLINALARQCVEQIAPDGRPITRADVDDAKERLIVRRDTHLDSLADKLREDRVRRVIAPMLQGEIPTVAPSNEDIEYVVDLGLIVRRNGIEIANPIYREVIPRELASQTADFIHLPRPTWLDGQGRLVPDALITAFLTFWRQNGEALAAVTAYPEIAPHLVLMAFLHRVVNGGGTIEREYAIGMGAIDLCVRCGETVLAIEVKRWRDRDADPATAGIAQLDGYLEGLGLDRGYLIVFDQRERRLPVEQRIAQEARQSPGGRAITVVRA